MLHNLVRQMLLKVENINAFGLFSLFVFLAFFTGVLVWAFALKKNYLNKMGGLPLDGGDNPQNPNGKNQS
jgi:hypothetical protein